MAIYAGIEFLATGHDDAVMARALARGSNVQATAPK
jgi:hypothetical protein